MRLNSKEYFCQVATVHTEHQEDPAYDRLSQERHCALVGYDLRP